MMGDKPGESGPEFFHGGIETGSIKIGYRHGEMVLVVKFTGREEAPLQSLHQCQNFSIRHFSLQRKGPPMRTGEHCTHGTVLKQNKNRRELRRLVISS